jgi:hypothetical protein
MGSRLKKSLKVLSQRALGGLTCYRLKVTLSGTDPVVWRHVQVDGEFSLGGLHDFIQEVFGWEDCHLHKFTLNKEEYMDRVQSRRKEGEIWDEDIALCFLKLKKGQQFSYEYDFGDCWKHEIVIEDVFQLAERDDYDMVIDGAGACPPEECGGLAGYYALVAAYTDKSNERHKDAVSLLGPKFDPAVWKDKKKQMKPSLAQAKAAK